MKYDIFISYCRNDKAVVLPYVKQISEAVGRNCWIDLKGIESGVEFEEVIIKAINDCQVVLFMLSDSSLRSNWTKREVIYAEDEGKRIVPVLVDGERLRGWFKFHFGNVDFIDIRSEEQMEKLVSNLRTWLGVEEEEARRKAVEEEARRKEEERRKQDFDIKEPSTEPQGTRGAEIHFTTDTKCNLYRFSKLLLTLQTNKDNIVYLMPGKHKLTFVSTLYNDVKKTKTYFVPSENYSDIIEVSLKEEIEARNSEDEAKRKEEELRRKVKEEAKRKEEEELRRAREEKQQKEAEERRKLEEERKRLAEQRRKAEEEIRKREEEEKQRKAAEEERLRREELTRRREELARQMVMEKEQKRRAEAEQRRKEEEERRKLEEQRKWHEELRRIRQEEEDDKDEEDDEDAEEERLRREELIKQREGFYKKAIEETKRKAENRSKNKSDTSFIKEFKKENYTFKDIIALIFGFPFLLFISLFHLLFLFFKNTWKISVPVIFVVAAACTAYYLYDHHSTNNERSFPDSTRIQSEIKKHKKIIPKQEGNTININVRILKGHTDNVNSAVFSPDGRRIVSASSDSTIRVWDATTGTQIGHPLKGHKGCVNSAVFSPDGKKIASASSDSTIRIWDATTGKQIGQLIGHTDNVLSAAFSPDGTSVVSASIDRTIRIWSTATKQQIGQPLQWMTGELLFACFSPNGENIIAASWDSSVTIWDVATGHLIIRKSFQKDRIWFPVTSAVYSPDGKQIASTDYHYIRIWNTPIENEIGTEEKEWILTGHTDMVWSVSFSPDGNKIVSASADKTIIIWDATTGEQIGQPLKGHTNTVRSASFSPDGKCIVSASSDGTVRIWDVSCLYE